MFYSKQKIENLLTNGELEITPFDSQLLKGSSYTFTLGNRIKVLQKKEELDSRVDPEFDELEILDDGFALHPGDFALLYTNEKVNLKGKHVCLLTTRSTIAQMGLDVTQSSFLCEPDTDNKFVLEVTNRGPISVRLYKGIKIVKGLFSSVD